MPTAISFTAQVLPLLPPLVAVVVWLLLPAPQKKSLAILAVAALVVATVLVQLAGALYDDPRPFVTDPARPALFPHPADNGFPSDHTAYAATAALLVLQVRRRLGIALVLLAALAGLARVGANVHRWQDIIAALLIAALAVWLSTTLAYALQRRKRDRAQVATEPSDARIGEPTRGAPLAVPQSPASD